MGKTQNTVQSSKSNKTMYLSKVGWEKKMQNWAFLNKEILPTFLGKLGKVGTIQIQMSQDQNNALLFYNMESRHANDVEAETECSATNAKELECQVF